MPLLLPTQVALVFAGAIFLLALVLGIWKFAEMASSPDGKAHIYVDTAHRSALLYAFASALLAPFAQYNDWSQSWNTAAVVLVAGLFLANVLNYAYLGWRKSTTNQIRPVTPTVIAGISVIIVGEIGGFAFLFAGFLVTQFG